MKALIIALSGAIACCAAAACGAEVTVGSPWVRATAPGQTIAGAYFKITSTTAAYLVGASSTAAKAVELHEMTLENNVMKMRPVARLELPAGTLVELKPGGYHLMLVDVARPLVKGDSVPLKLTVEEQGGRRHTVDARAEVGELVPWEVRMEPNKFPGITRGVAAALVGGGCLLPGLALACASCGCSLSSDWETQGYSALPGWKLDMRYDYLNQNQLRSGTGTISPQAASQIVTKTGPQEVESYTKNQYLTTTIDYSNGQNWGVSFVLPYINRDHGTLGTGSDGVTPVAGGGSYYSSTSSFGDLKVIGRYNGFTPNHDYGVLFGIKLPTGDYKLTGTSTDPANPGALAPIDRGLQPGTGITDLIVGAYHFDLLSQDWGYFAQAMYQRALDYRDGYQPGDGLNVNFGVRYMAFSKVTPQLQVNVRNVQHDRGVNADHVSTGGTLAYLSPGAIVSITKDVSAYGFVQVPVYQNVTGVQLAPRFIVTAGMRLLF